MDFDYNLETITPDLTAILTIGGTGCLQPPSGTTAQQPGTAVAGALRWNSSLSTPSLEYYNLAIWIPLTFNGLSPMSTPGDIIYESGFSVAARLGIGTAGQVLTVNSGATAPQWSTVGAASYSVNVGPSGTIAWVLVSGTTYNAIITHNLGTQNVVVQMADIANNQVVNSDLITINSATQVTVQVNGNTRTLRVVIIANGASIAAGGSTPSSIIVQSNGVAVTGSPFTTLNFAGALTTTGAGSVATITESAIRALTYVATSLDSPNNADWTVNALAATIVDATNNALSVRTFSNVAEQGVGFTIPLPTTATNIIFAYQMRPVTAPGVASTSTMKLYMRTVANATTPAAVGAWSAATTFTNDTVPTNAFYQSYSHTYTLATLGITAGNVVQFEFTRAASGVASFMNLLQLTVSFT